MSPLFPELLAAHELARKPDLHAALMACNLHQAGGGIWGVDFVEVDQRHYAPVAAGKPAVITPLWEDGVLVDLIATSIGNRAMRTRRGIATVLGEEWLAHARETDTAARLFPDPIAWLQSGRAGVVIVDWKSARVTLADLPALACETDRLAVQVDTAMRTPVHIPQLFVRERHQHAAA